MVRQFLQVTFLFGILVIISSCGGGSSGSTGPVNPPPPPPPVADFSLVVESPTITIQQGGALQFQTVQANPLNGFAGTVQLAISGLPTGVTGTPSGPYSIQVTNTGAAAVAFQLQAALSSAIATTSITVTATSGSISHTITFSVKVTQAAPWTLQVLPGSVSVGPGMLATVTVSVTSTSPTPPQIFLALPDTTGITGIDFLPPENILTPTHPVQFSINPGAQAQPLQNYPFILTATDNSSGDTASYTLPLTVTIPYSTNANPTRSTFARTDQAPTGMVYDQQRKLLFVSVEILNEVVVLSTVDGHQVGSIPVQFPSGIDESIDGTKVYVVSPLVSGITTIDPDLLQVIGKANAPANIAGGTLAPDFFAVATLSNGTVMLQETGDNAPILLWTPETNAFVQLDPRVVIPAAGTITRTADHSRVLGFGTGGAVVYDATSNSFGPVNPNIHGSGAINPTGTQIISVGSQLSPTIFYDANLNPLASMQMDVFPVTGVAYSLDGQHAYVFSQQNDSGGDIATVIDTTKFQVVGLVPGFKFGEMLPFSNESITTFAVDETGMLFGAAFQGVGFVDVTKPTSLAFPPPQWFLATPSLTSLSGPTSVQLQGATFTPSLNFSLFAGAPPTSPQSLQAANVSASSSNIINATIPAGTVAGPVNLTLARSDGFFEVMPDAVTFGPTILRVDANAGSPSGGDAIKIYGYGFDAGSPSVTIGGKTASITQVHESIQGGLFPTESIDVTTPSGLAGDADVVVSSSSGSAAVTGGFQFLKSIQVYPLAGALDAIVYDQPRQRLYISNQDHSEVEIFDLTANAFLAPIPVGMQPTNLALTPDGTILAVLDQTNNAVAVVDPAKMQMKTSYSALTPSDANPGCGGLATGMTAAAPHRAMVNVVCTQSAFGGVFHLLNLDTGSLSCVGVTACASNGTDINFGSGVAPLSSTPDGTKIWIATDSGGGTPLSAGILDLTANTLTSNGSGDFNDSAVSADGNVFAGNSETFDATAATTGFMAFEVNTDAGAQSVHNIVGEKLNAPGSILFSPQDSGVDLFDARSGRLLLHVAVQSPLPFSSGVLAIDETATKMFMISNTGITIAQFDHLPLTVARVIPPTAGPGATVTLRGSGFVTGASISFGTVQTTSTFVDSQTLKVVVPSLPSGPLRVTVSNPDGHQYNVDDAFTVN